MVTATVRRQAAFSGVRPLDVTRDMGSVAIVLEEAFRGEMDPAGERIVREMRMMGRLGPLTPLLDWFAPISAGFMPGFVWVEDGRIVGNATLQRTPAWGQGWTIGNVAVLPEYRGRGIGRQLMETCLAHVRDRGGEWVALEVRADNAAARRLYLNLGFRQTGAVVQLRREAIPAAPRVDPPGNIRIRKPHAWEGWAIFSLAQSVVPQGVRWADPLRESEFILGWDRSLDLWLSGRREAWLVAEADGKIVGAIKAETHRNSPAEGRLWLWAAAGSPLCAALLSAALNLRRLSYRSVVITHPAVDVAALATLERFGFRTVRTLAHMKLDLK